ncbi:unnamed protein product [Dovyalis caffra]|uniref:Uncharacterized protein n=1 Tax=Dovyalis caffra TaxID=77055 RepID=A0AAV1RM04_9ROSI|nr:unnamed protein product [Dovyalis caffra]
MVAVFNKDLLSWYLITLKLRETVESAVPKSPAGAPLLEFPEQPQQELQKLQQTPSDSLQIVIKSDEENHEEEEARSPDFDWVISIKGKLDQAGQDDAAGVAEGFKKLGYPRNDPVFAMRGSMHSIQRDMIMLENQLPLFVLDQLLGLQFNNQKGLVAQLALVFFDPLMPTDEPLTKSDRNRLESSLGCAATFDPLSDQGGLHCLDVFRRSLLRTGPKLVPRNWIKRWSNANRVADKRRQQLIHCVTELREAGIKLRKRKTDRFWDCHIDCGNEITSYVIFMDNLINSPEDVAYLHYCGIMEHWLGSDADVADLFNQLCREVRFLIAKQPSTWYTKTLVEGYVSAEGNVE